MRRVAILAGVLLLCGASGFCSDGLMTVIEEHYPERLMFEEEGEPDPRFWDYQVIDLDGDSSSQEIVVLYSNSSDGLLCALRLQGANAERICADELFGGSRAALKVMDLDSDGRPEFAVRFHSFRDGAGYIWLFHWRNGWETLTPAGKPLRAPLFIDLDGDGDLDALDSLETGAETQFMYFWGGNRLETGEARVVDSISIRREEGPPKAEIFDLSVGETEQQYRVRLAFDEAVTSAILYVNGVTVFAPHHFRPGVRALLSPPLPLRAPTQLSVEIRGKPGATMRILVESQ